MSFERRWLLKDRVCYIQFTATIALADVKELSSRHQALSVANERRNPIHYIVDTTKVIDYPRDIRSINRQLAGRITGIGWMLMITNDYFIEHLCNVFAQLFHFNVRMSSSLKDAYRFLQSIDEVVSLPQSWPDNIHDTMPIR